MIAKGQYLRMYFNSQPHEEADWKCPGLRNIHSISTRSLTRRLTAVHKGRVAICNISTRSLTRRLTSRVWNKNGNYRYFNSQPHEEADLMDLFKKLPEIFQLAASRGG